MTIISTTAISLVASLVGSTEFESLKGIQAIPLNTHEMAETKGHQWLRYNRKSGGIFIGQQPQREVDIHGTVCFAGGAPVFIPMGDGVHVTTSTIAMICL